MADGGGGPGGRVVAAAEAAGKEQQDCRRTQRQGRGSTGKKRPGRVTVRVCVGVCECVRLSVCQVKSSLCGEGEVARSPQNKSPSPSPSPRLRAGALQLQSGHPQLQSGAVPPAGIPRQTSFTHHSGNSGHYHCLGVRQASGRAGRRPGGGGPCLSGAGKGRGARQQEGGMWLVVWLVAAR